MTVNDFVVISLGDTVEEAAVHHEEPRERFLLRYKQYDIRPFKWDKVPFIGHVASKDG